MRLFYAVMVPKHIQEQIAPAQKKLRGNWRAVRPDHMHITLAFMPQYPEGKSKPLLELGEKISKGHDSFLIQVRGTGYFPNEGSPRVWFVKTEAPELQEISEALTSQIDYPFEEQAFKPHITLARKKGPAPRVPPVVFDLSWKASSFVLVHSTLQPSGPTYKILKTFRFRDFGHSSPSPSTTVE